MSWKLPIKDMVKRKIKTDMQGEVQKAFTIVEDNLLHVLANQQKLFLPAARTFLDEGTPDSIEAETCSSHWNKFVHLNLALVTLQLHVTHHVE